MRATVRTLHVPKAGSSEDEYEDAFSVNPAPIDGLFIGASLAAAVADGASEAMLAKLWARRLVSTFTESPPDQDLRTTILAAAEGWDAIETEYRRERDEADNAIAWYEEDGLRSGSYATIVGVYLLDPAANNSAAGSGEGSLTAWALGDACLFQVREEELITAFPIADPAAFGGSPSLAPSRGADPLKISQHRRMVRGTWKKEDRLYLVSDALAHWFLSQVAVSGAPWDRLSEYGTDVALGGFAMLVENLRYNGVLKNDDTTLVRIEIHDT